MNIFKVVDRNRLDANRQWNSLAGAKRYISTRKTRWVASDGGRVVTGGWVRHSYRKALNTEMNGATITEYELVPVRQWQARLTQIDDEKVKVEYIEVADEQQPEPEPEPEIEDFSDI